MSNDATTNETKPAPKKTTTLDNSHVKTPAVDAAASAKPRFMLSGIDHADYAGTRIRRLETYQVATIRAGLKQIGITKLDDFDAIVDDEKKVRDCASWLQCCLVGKESSLRKVAQLFRKGSAGQRRMITELRPRDIVGAMKTAAEFCEFF